MPRKKKIEATNSEQVINIPKLSKTPQLLKGMKDIVPAEQKYWQYVDALIRTMMQNYSFDRIDLPIMEDINLFTHSVGKITDIVEKEMYAFEDKSGEMVALRPEFTASIARAFIEHGMINQPQPLKLYTTGPLFRHDKPQAGRFRQFNQFNCEIIGESKPAVDVHLIHVAYNFFKELKIDTTVSINSIGCPVCRASYREALADYYKSKKGEACQECNLRLSRNVLRLLDCKDEKCRNLKKEAPQIIDFFCDECRDHFMKVLDYLDELNIAYQLDPFLVRGLDYYNRTTFEFFPVANSSDESPTALAGGGRYDHLIETLGGKPTPACGFAVGLERVIIKLKEMQQQNMGPDIPEKREIDIYIAQLGEQAKRKAMLLFEDLIKEGYRVAEGFVKDSLKAQLEQANKLAVKYTLILGQKELVDGTIIIRNMEGGEQEVVDFKKLIIYLRKKLNMDKNN